MPDLCHEPLAVRICKKISSTTLSIYAPTVVLQELHRT